MGGMPMGEGMPMGGAMPQGGGMPMAGQMAGAQMGGMAMADGLQAITSNPAYANVSELLQIRTLRSFGESQPIKHNTAKPKFAWRRY